MCSLVGVVIVFERSINVVVLEQRNPVVENVFPLFVPNWLG